MCCKQHFKFPSFTKRITADFKMHIVRMISKNKLTTQKQKLYGGNCFTVKQIFIVQASNKQLSLWCRSEKGDIFNVSHPIHSIFYKCDKLDHIFIMLRNHFLDRSSLDASAKKCFEIINGFCKIDAFTDTY